MEQWTKVHCIWRHILDENSEFKESYTKESCWRK